MPTLECRLGSAKGIPCCRSHISF